MSFILFIITPFLSMAQTSPPVGTPFFKVSATPGTNIQFFLKGALASTPIWVETTDNTFQSVTINNSMNYYAYSSSDADLTIHGDIVRLSLTGNPAITGLEFSNTHNIDSIACNSSSIEDIDIKGCTSLRYLYATGNNISNIDLSTSSNLEVLYLTDNNLSSINLSPCTNLITVELSTNHLSQLNFSDNHALVNGVANSNQLISVNYANGNNDNLNNVQFLFNPDLECIQVDNPSTTTLGFMHFFPANPVLSSIPCYPADNYYYVVLHSNYMDNSGSWVDYATEIIPVSVQEVFNKEHLLPLTDNTRIPDFSTVLDVNAIYYPTTPSVNKANAEIVGWSKSNNDYDVVTSQVQKTSVDFLNNDTISYLSMVKGDTVHLYAQWGMEISSDDVCKVPERFYQFTINDTSTVCPQIEMNTNFSVYGPIVYNRIFEIGQWEDMVLPFAVNKIEAADDVNGKDVINYVTTTSAGYFYMKKFSSDYTHNDFREQWVFEDDHPLGDGLTKNRPYIIQFSDWASSYFENRVISFTGYTDTFNPYSTFSQEGSEGDRVIGDDYQYDYFGNKSLHNMSVEKCHVVHADGIIRYLDDEVRTLKPFRCYWDATDVDLIFTFSSVPTVEIPTDPTITDEIIRDDLSLYSTNNMLHIESFEEQTIRVFNLQGIQLFVVKLKSSEKQSFSLPQGCYIVTSNLNNKSIKISIL